MRCRLIDTGYNHPFLNMAIDEALLESSLPVLRFYRWKPPGLSIGYFQNHQQIDKEFCRKNNIDIVRRLTGGNAVLHDDELTYSFIIDEVHMPESVTDSYKEISRAILFALNSLGLDARMNEDVKKEQRSDVCFKDPSWYEILVDEKKIVGSAQKRIDKKLLQHGAILLGIDIPKYCMCFKRCDDLLIDNLKNRMTAVNLERDPVTYSEMKQEMIRGFEKLGFELVEDQMTDEEIKRAEALARDKYSTETWNTRF